MFGVNRITGSKVTHFLLRCWVLEWKSLFPDKRFYNGGPCVLLQLPLSPVWVGRTSTSTLNAPHTSILHKTSHVAPLYCVVAIRIPFNSHSTDLPRNQHQFYKILNTGITQQPYWPHRGTWSLYANWIYFRAPFRSQMIFRFVRGNEIEPRGGSDTICNRMPFQLPCIYRTGTWYTSYLIMLGCENLVPTLLGLLS